MSGQQYFEWKGFEEVYLEDSYVLAIEESGTTLNFEVETVLTERHPLYTPPKKDEQYCYRRSNISFPEIRKKVWNERNLVKARTINLDGSIDYGNVDYFFDENGTYRIGGDWGDMSVVSAQPQIQFSEEIEQT